MLNTRRCLPSNNRRDGRRGFGLHAWNYVGVLLQRERRVLVTETFADHLGGYACLKCDGRMSVSKVV